jgi:hypothetical protein
MSKILLIGIGIVGFLEILVSTSLMIGSEEGSLFGLSFDHSPFPTILIQILMVLVFTGMLSVIGNNAVFASRFYEDLIKKGEMPFCSKFRHKLNSDRPIVGSMISLVLFGLTLLIIFLGGM